MTHEGLEPQFKMLAELVEIRIKASEAVICEKVSSLNEKVVKIDTTVTTHVEWHNTLNRRIVSSSIKGGLCLLGFVVVVVVILGVKGGVITSLFAGVLG